MSHPPIVLIVEDDDSNREMYSVYLESAGFWVLGARNGTEGLTEARRYQPHVIVTDISMPGMDGWELARAIREDKSTHGIGIIAVSGREYVNDAVRESKRSVDVVLTKPCLPDELLKNIRQLLARGRLASIKADKQLARAARLKARLQPPLQETQEPKNQRRRR